MHNICVVGTGYVGLVTGACFADLGNRVACLDVNEAKIAGLKQGVMPIYEPGLEELVTRDVGAGRLSFTNSYEEAINGQQAEFAFIAVGTPTGVVDGQADLQYVRQAAESLAEVMDHELIVVNKSTVPVGTGDWVANIVRTKQRTPIPFAVVSNPEFLREGSAIADCMNPDRIVLGSLDKAAAGRVAQLYAPLNSTIMITDLRTAEMIKYASNAFLASRISFVNEIAAICDQLGADVTEVARGMGLDRRIGPHFLQAGLGWGGSCFPKDVQALAHMAVMHGTHPQLLRAVIEINVDRRRRVVQRLREWLLSLAGKTIGVLGLAFKPNTDDIRESPAIDIIHMLQAEGALVRAYDPVAMNNARRLLSGVEFCDDPYQVAQNADALVIATDWNEFKQLDRCRLKELMRRPVIVDGRNIFDPAEMRALGFIYWGMGRGASPEAAQMELDQELAGLEEMAT